MNLEHMVLNIVELLYCAIDVMLLHYYCSLFMQKRRKNQYIVFLYVATVLGISLATNEVIFSSVGTVVSILIMIVYGFLIFESKPYRIVCSVGLYFIGSGIVTLFTATAIPIIFKTDISIIMTDPIMRAGIVLVTKMMILVIGYLYNRKFKKSSNGLLNIKSMLWFFIVAFVILILLFEFVYLRKTIPLENLVVIMSLAFIVLIVIIAILTMNYISTREKNMLVDIQLQEANLKNQEYIRMTAEQVEVMQVKHDLKNHLIVLNNYICQNRNDIAIEYLKKLFIHPGLKTYVDSNNKIMNAILNHKISEYPNIRFKVRHDDGKYDITADKLTIIMGNALDNAIEAVSTINDAEIKVVLSENDEYIKIFISNHYVQEPVIRNGMLVSQKDMKFSGMGITNIEQAAKSVCGEVLFKIDDGVFKLIVLISKQFNQ